MTYLLLMCRIDGRLAAFCATRVRSVIEIDAITPIPGTPDFIVGLTALRSQALTVIDCRVALGLPPLADPLAARAAVVELDGHLYALLVDDAYDVAEVAQEPAALAGGFGKGWQRAATGMFETADGPVLLLDVDQLLKVPTARAA